MTSSPDELNRLDRMLRSVRFEPRASLGAEVVGRWRRREVRSSRRATSIRRMLGISGAVCFFVLGLLVFWAVAVRPGRPVTVDRCCQDLDGGGDSDDGLLVVTHNGQTVKRLAIYEDRDGSRSLTAGDAIRFQRAGRLEVTGPVAGARTVEFCCLDYDGGGPADDVLLVVGQPPDRISLAAIYERFGPPGVPMELR